MLLLLLSAVWINITVVQWWESLHLYQAQDRSCLKYCCHLWDESAKYQLATLVSIERKYLPWFGLCVRTWKVIVKRWCSRRMSPRVTRRGPPSHRQNPRWGKALLPSGAGEFRYALSIPNPSRSSSFSQFVRNNLSGTPAARGILEDFSTKKN